MNYPEWAPERLIELHKSRTDKDSPERIFLPRDPEEIVADAARRHDGMTDESVENFRRHLYRTSFRGLPDKESTALLKLLITDPRMKDVWKALSKRVEKDLEFFHFFGACEGGITGWRGDQKQTASERKAFYQEIRDAAGKLMYLMNKASEFDFYFINELVDDQQVEWLLEVLDAPNEISYARFSVSEIIPSIYTVLTDISGKATQYGEEESPVKKPNSPNAEIHYFVRGLSDYCQRRYSQPLHETVAITASVIFDQQNIDTDYVRKIVKR